MHQSNHWSNDLCVAIVARWYMIIVAECFPKYDEEPFSPGFPYHKNLVPRSERAERAKIHFDNYNPNQQSFLDFVLNQYVQSGIDELDDSKLPDLLELKYSAITDAKDELGEIDSIRSTFIGFQEYLYEKKAV